MPPFSLPGREIIPVGKKNKVDRHIIGNNLPLMLLNFQCKFFRTFLVIVLDAIGPYGWILRYRSNYKRQGWRGSLSYSLSMLVREGQLIADCRLGSKGLQNEGQLRSIS